MKTKILALLGALAVASGESLAAPAPNSIAEDVADVVTRVCVEVESGRLRWDPADLAAEQALLESLGLTPGIPGGVLDGFGRNAASTFNGSILASRTNGASHLLLAVGGRMPGCRVSVAGAPGVITPRELAAVLQRKAYGWTPAPQLGSNARPIERHSFVRRTEDGRTLLLDLLFVTPAEGNFRLMAMIMRPPPGLELPPDF